MSKESWKQFKLDLCKANATEREIADGLQAKGFEVLELNDDYRYDIKVKLPDGRIQTIEVKEDFTGYRTGNLVVEFSCRRKDSGIAITESDYYLFKINYPDSNQYIFIRTSRLKRLIEEHRYHRIVNGGDPGSDSLCYLFRISLILENGKEWFI